MFKKIIESLSVELYWQKGSKKMSLDTVTLENGNWLKICCSDWRANINEDFFVPLDAIRRIEKGEGYLEPYRLIIAGGLTGIFVQQLRDCILFHVELFLKKGITMVCAVGHIDCAFNHHVLRLTDPASEASAFIDASIAMAECVQGQFGPISIKPYYHDIEGKIYLFDFVQQSFTIIS